VAYGTEAKETVVSINNYGIQLLAARQFFSVLKHRSERYDDVVTFNVVEVHDERLCDLLAGTDIGETNGRMEGSRKSNRKRVDSHDSSASPSSRPTKLEIRNNHNGETVVHGLLSVEVTSFEDVVCAWKECLSKRKARLSEQGVDFTEHESNSHVIGTLQVFSTNISTGVGTTGKIQFVDLASSDVIPNAPKRSGSKKVSTPEAMLPGFGNNQEWKCANRSLTTLSEVVNARSQFQRSVPYRNSTITHLLSDSLESDTKVVMVACVSSDPQDLQETACTLKFAQKMRKVAIGKATKHTLSHA
jgi:kinesin family protein C2/C3